MCEPPSRAEMAAMRWVRIFGTTLRINAIARCLLRQANRPIGCIDPKVI